MIDALQWGLGLGGLVLIAFGLFWDRPGWRGRAALRCRKCWFDLTGTPGVGEVSRASPVVCAECGKAHRSRRQMRRSRRHRRPIALALLLWVGAYGAGVWDETRQHGWVRAVPFWALVGAHVVFDDPTTVHYVPINSRTKKPTPIAEQLLAELQRRISSMRSPRGSAPLTRLSSWALAQYEIGTLDDAPNRLWRTRYLFDLWQNGLLSPGQIRAIRERAARDSVVYRDRWPVGVELRVGLRNPWNDGRFGGSWLIGPLMLPTDLSAEELRDWYIFDESEQTALPAAEIRLQANGDPVIRPFVVGFIWDWRGSQVTLARSSQWSDNAITIGEATGSLSARLTLPDGLDERPVSPAVDGRLGGRVYENTYEYKLVSTIDEAITPISGSAVDANILHALRIELMCRYVLDSDGYPIEGERDCEAIVDLDDSVASTLPEMTIAFRGSFVHDGESIAFFRMTRGTRQSSTAWGSTLPASARFEGDMDRMARLIESGASWSLVLEANPELALTQFQFDRYWKGRIEVPSSRVDVR